MASSLLIVLFVMAIEFFRRLLYLFTPHFFSRDRYALILCFISWLGPTKRAYHV